ncbi:hypothetical protein [Vibrio sp. SCSIO 43137]|uniref:hypothetical protein n=1 Tax=Vibrio sp. SCSIO 43137 TaxID=3021011 RepID=UPI002307E262|nr:hypothetical protein [Vibrio sp. SCSIO 43137]WCE28398.1 hypothetical protein PK654_08380 [Vibrio sp. SCSIO 43137]
MVRLLIGLSVVFLLSGCQLTRVEGEVDDVEVKISTKDDKPSSNGTFCPPGQAMKGRC